MSQIVINNTTVMPGGTDPSLAGRVPPVIKAYQLRPAPLDATDLFKSRKYADNNVPYISIYQDFILPITFQPTRIIPGSVPPQLESILVVTCKMTECKLEAPLYFDNPSISEPDPKNPGKARLRLPKFEPSRLLYYKGSNFFEPKILGQTTTSFVSISEIEAAKSYTGPNIPPQPGVPQNYTVKGYFTERNFYDREWIVQWGFLLYKINSNGVYWNAPLLDQLIGSMTGINKAKWRHSKLWTPNQFFQPKKELAKRYDGPGTEKYIKGAKKIIQYKPSEIGSLRFYFTFTCTTNFPGVPTETFEATMSVKYNTEFGSERLKVAQRKQNDKATSPRGEGQKGADTVEEARQTASVQPGDDGFFGPDPTTDAEREEIKKSLTLL